jgi:hypothetical protein
MHINILSVIVAALVPMVTGFVWFNPKVFGTAWMQATGMTPEKAKNSNMALVFGLTLILSFILAFSMQFMCIHQFHVTSLFFNEPIGDPSTEAGALYKKVMDTYGASWRTFKHGALHGFLGALFLVMPTYTIHALFEQKTFKHIAINVGYWLVNMTIMGGILSCWM